MEKIITKIQMTSQIKKEDKLLLPLLNLKKNTIIAIIDSIGNIIEYINIITPETQAKGTNSKVALKILFQMMKHKLFD